MRRTALPSFWILIVLAGLWTASCGHRAAPVPPPVAPAPASLPPARPPQPAPATNVPKPKPATTIGIEVVRPPIAIPATVNVNQRGPSIRIGLAIGAEELRISSTGEFVLVEKSPEAPRHTLTGSVQLRLEQPRMEPAEIFRVQVASLASRAAAEKLGKQMSEQFSVPALVRENTSQGTHQVRLGEFTTREEAQAFAAGPVAAAGYGDAFVLREAGEAARGERTLALRGPENLFRLSRTGYLFTPGSDAAFLQLNGKSYRGLLDVILGKNGRVLVVNQLGMEEYLPGVVPAELSPVIYPQEAALAAQAIAARTYALKNMGKFAALGFDLTDDSSTQVYGGASVEKSASNEAVRSTFGLALYYNGSLIDAMYMSTCGGRTEDFSEVFETPPVPYLKSVFCTVESPTSRPLGVSLGGTHDLKEVFFADDGSPANRELELAQALGLLSLGPITPASLSVALGAEEIRNLLEKGRSLAGRPTKPGSTPTAEFTRRAGFLRYAAELFFGAQEIERSVSESDTVYYLGNFSDGASVPAGSRHAVAYLSQKKLWQPYPDNSIRPNQAVQRGDAVVLLVKWILSTRPEILKTAMAAEPAAEAQEMTLAVKRGSRTETLPLAGDVRLFKMTNGKVLPADRLQLIGGERVAYHQRPSGEVDYLEIELSPTGASSDRFSPVATWQTTIPRAVAAEKLRSLAGAAGDILDLKPARLGASGRVVRLEIVGSRNSVVVNGYKARGALGLKDTLYTLSRARSSDGSVVSFTFDGRGWGHGIGLCQTGAVGMAKAGRSAEEILKAYYQGVEMRRAY